MTPKIKTVIGCYFLLPDFKSRGHPSREQSFLIVTQFNWEPLVSPSFKNTLIQPFQMMTLASEFKHEIIESNIIELFLC